MIGLGNLTTDPDWLWLFIQIASHDAITVSERSHKSSLLSIIPHNTALYLILGSDMPIMGTSGSMHR